MIEWRSALAFTMSWSGKGSSWNSYGGKGYSRQGYGQPYSGHGKGWGKGGTNNLTGLLLQLQGEIAAQQQLQAISSVLLPQAPAPMHGPSLFNPMPAPQPQHPASPTTDDLQQLRLQIESLRRELTNPPASSAPAAGGSSDILGSIHEELRQLRAATNPRPATEPAADPGQSRLVEEFARLQADLVALRGNAPPRAAPGSTMTPTPRAAPRAAPPAATSGTAAPTPTLPAAAEARAEPTSTPVASEAASVDKSHHKLFFSEVLGKRSLMVKHASLPIDEWAATQSAKLNEDELQLVVAKLGDDNMPDDSPEGILKFCYQQWYASKADSTPTAAGTRS